MNIKTLNPRAIGTKLRSGTVYIMLAFMLILAEIFSPGYLSVTHIAGILRLSAFMGIAAIGQTFAILTGGIDLSIDKTISFAYILAAEAMMGQDSNILSALIRVLILGVIIGLLNGLGIVLLNVPPFIMTLGIGSVVQGAYMIYTNGAPKGDSAPLMREISNGTMFGVVSGIVIVWAIMAIITIVVMKKTPYGRQIYSVGANSISARFSGINTKFIIFSVYIISAVVASFMGFLLIGYTGMSFLHAGNEYGTSVIAAVIIGGTAISGGKGGYLGTAAGAIMMTVLVDFLTIVDIPEAGRMVAMGALIVLILLIYAREKEKRV